MRVHFVLDFLKVSSLDEDPSVISNSYSHEIKIRGAPVFKKPYPIPFEYRDEMSTQTDSALRNGLIKHTLSNAPLLSARRRDGGRGYAFISVHFTKALGRTNNPC